MPSDIANLYVTLTADTAEYKAKMAEAEGAGTLLQSNIQGVGKASTEHIGGTATHNVGLLESAFGKVDSAIGGVLKSMGSMIGQSAGIGALFGGGAIIADAVKQAEDYNVAMAGVNTAFKNIHQNTPTQFINQTTTAMRGLGQSDVSTLTSIQQMTEAHIPLADQMKVLQAATDLSVGKNVDLQTALKAVEMGAQGAGARLFTQFGINLPAVIPKVASLTSATLAQHKAQEALTLATDKYGSHSPQVLAAQQKLGDATAKVNTITQEQANHWENLAGFSGQVEGLFGGLAASKVAADPLAQLGIEFQHIAEVGGQALLPFVHQFADYLQNHMPDIEKGATGAFHALGTAVSDTAGFFKNDLWPIAQTVIGYMVDHKQEIQKVAEAFGVIYGVHKVTSIGGSLLGDFQKVLAMLPGGSTSATGVGTAAFVQKVWVTNPGFGGTGTVAGTAEGVAAGAASGAELGGPVGGVLAGGVLSKLGPLGAALGLGLYSPPTEAAVANGSLSMKPVIAEEKKHQQIQDALDSVFSDLLSQHRSGQQMAGEMQTLAGVMQQNGPLTATQIQQFERLYANGVTTISGIDQALFPAQYYASLAAQDMVGFEAGVNAAALSANRIASALAQYQSPIGAPGTGHGALSGGPASGGVVVQGDLHVHGVQNPQDLLTAIRNAGLAAARGSGVNSLWGQYT